MPKEKIYFAHPINTYGTGFEGIALEVIKQKFPDHEIICPGTPEHEDGYRKQGMSYFTEILIPQCSITIGMPYLDGAFGAGVAAEIKKAFELGQNIYVIDMDSTEDILSPESFLVYIHFDTFHPVEDEFEVLDRLTTRGRTWASPEEYGKTLRSFWESHTTEINPDDWENCIS